MKSLKVLSARLLISYIDLQVLSGTKLKRSLRDEGCIWSKNRGHTLCESGVRRLIIIVTIIAYINQSSKSEHICSKLQTQHIVESVLLLQKWGDTRVPTPAVTWQQISLFAMAVPWRSQTPTLCLLTESL